MNDPSVLTADQEKAWKSFKRALKKCSEANIRWYQVLEMVHPLNGEIVEAIVSSSGEIDGRKSITDDEIAGCDSVPFTCSFADDTHYIILKNG